MGAGDVDDPSPPAIGHGRHQASGQPERGGQHHRDDGVPAFGGELTDRGDVLQAGVVDQDVDGHVEAVERGIDRVGVGQVDDEGVRADVSGDFSGGLGRPVEHDNSGTGGGKATGTGLTDAARRTGHEGRAARQVWMAAHDDVLPPYGFATLPHR